MDAVLAWGAVAGSVYIFPCMASARVSGSGSRLAWLLLSQSVVE